MPVMMPKKEVMMANTAWGERESVWFGVVLVLVC